MDIGNLPEGITWESNAEDNVFNVGTYYCVLLEGTPILAGNYPMHITVDIYIPGILGSPPINVGTVVDSTSLSIDVSPSGVLELNSSSLFDMDISPNPFTDHIDISFIVNDSRQIFIELYDITGTLISKESIVAQAGQNTTHFDGSALQPGIYIYSIRDKHSHVLRRVIKTK